MTEVLDWLQVWSVLRIHALDHRHRPISLVLQLFDLLELSRLYRDLGVWILSLAFPNDIVGWLWNKVRVVQELLLAGLFKRSAALRVVKFYPSWLLIIFYKADVFTCLLVLILFDAFKFAWKAQRPLVSLHHLVVVVQSADWETSGNAFGTWHEDTLAAAATRGSHLNLLARVLDELVVCIGAWLYATATTALVWRHMFDKDFLALFLCETSTDLWLLYTRLGHLIAELMLHRSWRNLRQVKLRYYRLLRSGYKHWILLTSLS